MRPVLLPGSFDIGHPIHEILQVFLLPQGGTGTYVQESAPRSAEKNWGMSQHGLVNSMLRYALFEQSGTDKELWASARLVSLHLGEGSNAE